MPLRSLQRLVWLHLRRPPKWQVVRKQCCALGGHHKCFPRLAVERRVLGGVALGEALCTEEDTDDLCQPLESPHMDFNAEFFF